MFIFSTEDESGKLKVPAVPGGQEQIMAIGDVSRVYRRYEMER